MNLQSRLRRKEGVASRTIAGEAFLVPTCGQPVDLQKIFVLNAQALFIWERLDGKHTVADLLESIVGEFAVDAEQARQDTLECLERLLEQDLLEGAS